MEFTIQSYGCLCGYTMDARTYDLPSYFANRGIAQGMCPSCRQAQLAPDLGEMSRRKVATNDELAQTTVEELDASGQPIMIQTGERYELRVNQQTGAVNSESVPVYEPKMRELTAQEIAELKEQRDQSLRDLEKIAV